MLQINFNNSYSIIENSFKKIQVRSIFMDKIQRQFYELQFELYFYKERGNGFEDFFSKVMKLKFKHNFTEVKTWGNLGDLKCDGYLSDDETIFQVYAPNEITGTKLLAKTKEDYQKAIVHWNGCIKHWILVQNSKDGVRGIEANTLQAFEKYKRDPGNPIKISIWGIDEIKEIVFSLPIQDLCTLFGTAPTVSDLQNLQIKHIQPFLTPFRIMVNLPTNDQDLKEVSQNKIIVNNLSDFIQDLLKIGMRKAHLIELIIEQGQDVDAIQNMSESFRAKYIELKSEYSSSDQIFYELRDFAGIKYIQNTTDELALLTILAYLFENCTIFENEIVNV